MRLCWVVVLVCVAACHHTPVRHPGEEYLSAIRFEGNDALSDDTLSAGLALHRVAGWGGAPDSYLVDDDAERIRGDYVRAGYVDVDVRARVQREGDAAVVIFKITEGARATTRVVITGLPEGDAKLRADVRAALPLADGAPFDYDAYDKAKTGIINVVEDAGYAHARYEAHVTGDRANHVAVVTLEFTLGPLCTFGDIVGVTGDLADSARARVAFDKGDKYSTAKLAETQRALYRVARFSTVRVIPDKNGKEVVGVRIALSESARHETRLGGGFGMDPLTYEARLRAGYTIAGWPEPLTTLDLDFRPAYALLRDQLDQYEPRIRARATFTRMDLFATNVTGVAETSYSYLVVEGYTSLGPGERLSVQMPLGTPRLQIRAGWRFEYLDFRDINPLVDAATQHMLGLDKTEQLGEYEQSFVVDLRDNPIEPSQGAYLEMRVAEGTPYAFGKESFVEIAPDVRAYAPLGPVTLAARAHLGAFFGDIPVSERFYGGGASGQRGFSERRLSPSLSGTVMGQFETIPIGGGAILDSSVEARFLLGHIRKTGLGGVVFLDGGDVTNTLAELDPGHLHWAAGFGIRAMTILGAVRADFGYRLNRTGPGEPDPDSSWAVHLGLGEAY